MGPVLHALKLVAALHGAAQSDTTTYATLATQRLVARAMARHAEQDSSVRDYQAKIRYRVSFGFARRKWGNPLPVAVEEQDATLAWHLPNDLRVDMLGRRSASRLQGVDLASTFAHPWFVPRTLGDSLRVFGASQTPTKAAPHPLAHGADQFYHYEAGDSVVITTSGHRITIQAVTVTPKRSGGSLVTGRLWLDVATGDVVRFTFRFVGTELWSAPEGDTPHDSAAARRSSAIVSRILELSADLEFSLQENRYWMPYRQVIAGKVTLPLGIDFAVPFEAKTTFDDYTINSGNSDRLRRAVPDKPPGARAKWRAVDRRGYHARRIASAPADDSAAVRAGFDIASAATHWGSVRDSATGPVIWRAAAATRSIVRRWIRCAATTAGAIRSGSVTTRESSASCNRRCRTWRISPRVCREK